MPELTVIGGGLNMHNFRFHGSAKEYFPIWIVNVLLSIVTLGIYSAWAKVRRLRYFYGNTSLDGHNFDYHAKPKQILIGRLIVFGVLIVLNVLIEITPAAAILFIPYFIALPYLINKGLQFNARMTSYRNVRFGFEGTYKQAFVTFLIMPLIAMLSLGIAIPFMSRSLSNYIGNNLRYGNQRFATDAKLGPLYHNWLAAVIFFVAAAMALYAVIFGIGFLSSIGGSIDLTADATNRENPIIALGGVLGVLGFYGLLFFVYIFYRAGVRNIAYCATTLGEGHPMSSNLLRREWTMIAFVNALATIVTIGLARPWAAVRAWRYKAEHTAVLGDAPLDAVVAAQQEAGGVTSAEFMDVEGFDFGL